MSTHLVWWTDSLVYIKWVWWLWIGCGRANMAFATGGELYGASSQNKKIYKISMKRRLRWVCTLCQLPVWNATRNKNMFFGSVTWSPSSSKAYWNCFTQTSTASLLLSAVIPAVDIEDNLQCNRWQASDKVLLTVRSTLDYKLHKGKRKELIHINTTIWKSGRRQDPSRCKCHLVPSLLPDQNGWRSWKFETSVQTRYAWESRQRYV